MISTIQSNDLPTIRRCNTSILPDTDDNPEMMIRIQGYYWPRLLLPDNNANNIRRSSSNKKNKPVKKTRRRRKISFSDENYRYTENIKVSPNIDFDLFALSSSPSCCEESSSSASSSSSPPVSPAYPEERQVQHSYCWIHRSVGGGDGVKSSSSRKTMSRLIPPSKFPRKKNTAQRRVDFLLPVTETSKR